jgi:antitoxin MazE
MRAEIIPVGNSLGIRLPKSVLEQCHFQKIVDIEVVDQQLIIKAIDNPREGWTESFLKETSAHTDTLEDDVKAISNQWDKEEWQW